MNRTNLRVRGNDDFAVAKAIAAEIGAVIEVLPPPRIGAHPQARFTRDGKEAIVGLSCSPGRVNKKGVRATMLRPLRGQGLL